MSILKVAILQTTLHWESPALNRADLAHQMDQVVDYPEVFVLPEMFTTGFSMRSKELAEPMDGPSVNWMKEQSDQRKAVICGSVMIRESGNAYNRFLWVTPEGNVTTYDKRHLFGFADEDNHFTAGKEQVIIEYKGWRIMPIICYDLRFPVWSRQPDLPYDLLICVANFPAVRSFAWKTLLKARAVENLCYVLGCNIVGKNGKGIMYCGDSAILDFSGESIQELSARAGTLEGELDFEALNLFRRKFPFLQDRDRFDIDL